MNYLNKTLTAVIVGIAAYFAANLVFGVIYLALLIALGGNR